MYFPSKKDLWLTVINWVVIFACFLPIFTRNDYEALIFTISLAIILVWSWFTTGYKISNELLIIQHSPLKKKILIKDIKK